MISYSIYDPDTGAFSRYMTLADSSPAPANSVVGNYSGEAFAWDGKQVVPVTQWAPVVEPNKISGLPPSTHVRWGGAVEQTAVVDDGLVEFDLVGDQVLKVTLHPVGHGVMTAEVRP